MREVFIAKQDAVSIIEKEMEHYISDIWYKSATHSALNDVNEYIKALEPADVAPVVRCKDCKFYTSMRPDIKTGICDLNVHHMGDDGFCSCGERREE